MRGSEEMRIEDIRRVGGEIPGGCFVYRAEGDGEVLYINRVLLGYFGCETQEEFRALTGGTFRGMVHPEDYEAVEEAIRRQVEASEDALDYVEYRILRRDGEVRWLDDYGRLARLEGEGEVFYVFVSDATQRRLEEEERFRMELELARERRANEIKESFLFSISHDIRTPLNAVIGYTQLAKRHRDERARLDDALDKVETASRQLLELIDDMLEMNRLNSGHVLLDDAPADLWAEVENTLDLFRAEAEEKGIALTLSLEGPAPTVLVDAARFRRVLANLLSNAVKFTPAGGSVTVTARRKEATDSGFARFAVSVADTGEGISEAFRERMFNAFEREESSTRSGRTGMGLGLSIVKSLLDLMGGTLSVESEKGRGTVFTVELPLKLADAPLREEPPAPEDVRARGEHRILLVEDIEINRLLAEAILMEAGFLVEAVPDGCDAVEAVERHAPYYYDLILMDIQMPVMNGYEATRMIRRLPRPDVATLPILALSANAREEDKRMSEESGMNGHMAKPFDAAKLVLTMNGFIKAREELLGTVEKL